MADQDPKQGKTSLTRQNYFLDAAFYTIQKTYFRATNFVIFHITFDFFDPNNMAVYTHFCYIYWETNNSGC